MPPPHASRAAHTGGVAPAGRPDKSSTRQTSERDLVSQGRTYTIFRLSHRRRGVTVLRPQPVMSHHDEAPGAYFWDRGYKNRTVEFRRLE